MKWTIKRKKGVLDQIDSGAIDEVKAFQLYGTTRQELDEWRRMIDKHGIKGLRVTKLTKYRDME